METLSPDRLQKVQHLGEDLLALLEPGQKSDLMFLGSGMLVGVDLDKRQDILKQLKKNDGKIGYEDLVRIGIFREGELAEGGIKRFLQNLDTGGPANFSKLLEQEYRLTQDGTSFADLDRQERQRRSAEMTMLFAMTAAPLLDAGMYKQKVAYGDNAYDNLERQGTRDNIKGSRESWKPSEGAGEVLEDANFAQKTYSSTFSAEGQRFYTNTAGVPIKTVDDLVNALEKELIKPSNVPIDYIVRDGKVLILNTRSSNALIQAGIPRNQWNAVDRTGIDMYESMLNNQLKNNGLTSAGTSTVKMTGGR